MGDDICKAAADEHLTALQQSELWDSLQMAIAMGQLGVQQSLDEMNDLLCKAMIGTMHCCVLVTSAHDNEEWFVQSYDWCDALLCVGSVAHQLMIMKSGMMHCSVLAQCCSLAQDTKQ